MILAERGPPSPRVPKRLPATRGLGGPRSFGCGFAALRLRGFAPLRLKMIPARQLRLVCLGKINVVSPHGTGDEIQELQQQ